MLLLRIAAQRVIDASPFGNQLVVPAKRNICR